MFCYPSDSNFDPRAASYEITKVYMPDVWTATEGIYAPLGVVAAEDSTSKTADEKEAPSVEAPKEKEEAKSTTKATVTESSKTSEEASTKTTTTTSAPEQQISADDTSSTAAAAAAATASTASNVVAEESEKEASTGSGGGPHFSREYLEQEVLEKVERCTVAELLKLLQGQLEVVVPKNNKSKHPRKEILISMVRERVAELIAQMESGGGSSADKTSEKAVPETTAEITTTTTKAAEVVENGKGESEEKQSEVVVSNGESEEKEVSAAAEAGAEKTSSSSNKRKAEEEETAVAAEKKTSSSEEATKKQKTSSEEAEVVKKVSTASEETSSSSCHSFSGVTSSLKVKGVGLSVVSLAALLTPHKHDQFELCVVAELLGDALALHFARYIHSAVLANFHLITAAKAKTAEPVEKVCWFFGGGV